MEENVLNNVESVETNKSVEGGVRTEINENLNINGSVTVEENGSSVQIMLMSCSLSATTLGLNINVTVIDKEKYKDHLSEIKEQYDKFSELCKERAKYLGYGLF